MKIFGMVLAGAVSFLSVSVHAFPIAKPGTEGQQLFTTSGDSVIATYQGNSASYSNDLYLMLDENGLPGNDGDTTNDLFIFNNHTSPIGSTVDIGSFAIETELLFRIHVNNTGYDFFTGVATNNADGQFHARVEENWQPNTTLVSFEDLYDLSGNSSNFNDLSFSFSNTSVVPEPETYAMFLMGLGLIGAMARCRQRTA